MTSHRVGVHGGVFVHAGEMFDARQEKTGRLVVVCGLPASGKTTLGIRLETEYGAIRLSPDEWMEAIGVDLFDERTREDRSAAVAVRTPPP